MDIVKRKLIFVTIGTQRVKEKKKKVVVMCSRPSQNVKLGIFTS